MKPNAPSVVALWLAAFASVVPSAAAEETRRVSPATPPDTTATLYDWSPAAVPEVHGAVDPEPETPIARAGWIVLPFAGVIFAGSGSAKAEVVCSPGACDSASIERNYQQNVNPLFGIETLYHVLPMLRVGVGLQAVPSVSVEFEDGNQSHEFGAEIASLASVEGVFGGKHAGAVRGLVGANLLFPHGDLLKTMDRLRADCRNLDDPGQSCNVDSGPYTGLTLGAAAAYIVQMSERGAVRIELSFHYVGYSGPKLEASDEVGNRAENSVNWSDTRFSLRVGAEL